MAILRGVDLYNLDVLSAQLEQAMKEHEDEDNPWDRISIACGYAHCEDPDTTVEDVFNRADANMYTNKNTMKKCDVVSANGQGSQAR